MNYRSIFAVVSGLNGRVLALAAVLSLAGAAATQAIHELDRHQGKSAVEKSRDGDRSEQRCEVCAALAALGHGIGPHAPAEFVPHRFTPAIDAPPACRVRRGGIAQRNRGPPPISFDA